MRIKSLHRTILASAVVTVAACSNSNTGNPGAGGSPATGNGGATATSGGATATSGGATTTSSGGATAKGGTTSTGNGGTATSSGGAGTSGSTAQGGGSAMAGGSSMGGTTGGGATGGGATGMGGSTAGSTGTSGGTTGVTVKLDATHQTIRGFGINTALMDTSKTIPVDNLFGTTGADAIGLSILRVGMNSDGSLTGKYVAEAKAKNAKIIGSCWSPPAKCKSNNNTQQGGYLLDSNGCFDSWSTAIANFAKAQGLYAMSVANESDFASCKAKGPPCTDDYDTTTYTAKQMVAWIKVVGAKIKSVSPDTKVIAPEASEWIHAWSTVSATGSTVSSHPQSSDPLNCGCFSNDPSQTTGCAQTCLDGNGYDYGHWLWKDQDAWKSFDIFGVHEYDSQKAFPWPADVNNGVQDKEIWQTEMSGVKYWPEEGPSTDINNGVVVGSWIHSALTVGQASAWLWWWYESYYQNDNEGLALTQGSSTIAKRYYVLGNYSKFIRPDYVMVDVVGNSNADVLLSAAKGGDGTVVVVAINKGATSVTIPIAISGGTAPAMLTPNVTSATDNLKAGTAVAVTGGSFMASLPSKTVTTFVGK